VGGNQINNNNNNILPCHVFVFAVGVDCVTDKKHKGQLYGQYERRTSQSDSGSNKSKGICKVYPIELYSMVILKTQNGQDTL
jgi:hypothetical protein